MKEYHVRIIETSKMDVIVEAETEEIASSIARSRWCDGDYLFDEHNLLEVTFEVVSTPEVSKEGRMYEIRDWKAGCYSGGL